MNPHEFPLLARLLVLDRARLLSRALAEHVHVLRNRGFYSPLALTATSELAEHYAVLVRLALA